MHHKHTKKKVMKKNQDSSATTSQRVMMMRWMCRKLRSILNLSNYKLVFKHTQRKGSAFCRKFERQK